MPIVVVFILMLFFSGISANASRGANAPFIWWLPGTTNRLADGRAEQVVTVAGTDFRFGNIIIRRISL